LSKQQRRRAVTGLKSRADYVSNSKESIKEGNLRMIGYIAALGSAHLAKKKLKEPLPTSPKISLDEFRAFGEPDDNDRIAVFGPSPNPAVTSLVDVKI
jgi:hypothetical protein